MIISKDLPYTKTNIEGVDRHRNTLRVHTNTSLELTKGTIRLYTYELNPIEHTVHLTSDTILHNRTKYMQYIELTNNIISPCTRMIEKELHITHER